MAGLPYLTWFPGDWRKDPCVQCLDLEHKGAWFEMLNLMHESEERGVLRMQVEDLAVVLGIAPTKCQQIVNKLLQTGAASRQQNTGYLMNRRMVRETSRYQDISRKRAEAGRKSAEAKRQQKLQQKLAPSSSYSSPALSSSSSSSSSSTLKEKDKDKEPASISTFSQHEEQNKQIPNEAQKEQTPSSHNAGFNQPSQPLDDHSIAPNWASQCQVFLTAYPKKEGHKDVRAWFKQHQPTDALMTKILGAIAQQQRSKKWRDGCIFAPINWLNGEHWNDEPPPVKPRRVGI
jgi:hypothetical protein